MERIEKIWIGHDAFSEKGESDLLPKIERLNRESTVIVYINCPGGDLYTMFSFVDAFKMFAKKTIGVVIGKCYSASIDLFLSFDRRFCTPNSMFMIHESSLSFGDGYELTSKLSEEIRMQQKIESDRIKNVIKKTLIDKDTLKQYLDKKQDMYFSSSESVEWGLVEEIVKTEKELFNKLKTK